MVIEFINRHQKLVVHLAALFFLIAGLGYSIYLGNNLRYPDAERYYTIAVNLADGNGYSLDGNNPTAFRTPAYPLFLAFFIKCGASITVLRYLNFIILSLGIYVIRSILRASKAETGAPLAAVLLVAYGALFYTAGTLYTQTMLTMVLLLMIRVALFPRFGYRHATVLGILSGTLIMVHPSGIFIPPLIVLWLILPKKWNMIGKGVIAALVAIACISPWAYRNYLAFDKFIPISSHGSDTLYIGNNPQTNVAKWYEWETHEVYKKSFGLPEEELRRYYVDQVIKFWTEHPADAAKLYLEKLIYYFNYRNNLQMSNESSRIKDIILFITYYPLLLCLVVRLLFIPKVPLSRTEKLLVAIYFGSALFYAIFIPRIRFRLPFDAVLITHVGIMWSLIRKHTSSRDSSL